MSLVIAPLEALLDTEISEQERKVLLALYSFRNKNSDTVWPSLESLAARCRIKDVPRVSKVTSSLAKKGWLTKKKRGFTGCNEYRLAVPERLANLAQTTKLEESANTNLAQTTKSNLAQTTKYKEQQIEQQIEQSSSAPLQAIVDLYHEILPELPRCVKLTDKRKGQINARWFGSKDAQSLDWWRDYFLSVRESDFLMGKSKTNFRADLEFLTTESKFLRVLEKYYHDKEAQV